MSEHPEPAPSAPAPPAAPAARERRARRRLTADDWAEAALAALGERGLAGVAVEPLAARLGTTKGSFYWHFANRDALVAAALARWEEMSTERIIAAMEAAESDPAGRLATLLRAATASAVEDPLEVRLLAAGDHPEVAAALARVTERRVGYLARLFARLGFPPEAARHRAFLAYTSYLGHAQLSHALPGAVPADPAYLAAVAEALLKP
ncbi:TetR/AcrR family transcriptional regulator [Streptomyces laurentii]|uniref:TetR/AcrR family transcriptional regulator n=1 Tax=Streptomyces laurentii TaxID=39478 RepID=UPI003693A017